MKVVQDYKNSTARANVEEALQAAEDHKELNIFLSLNRDAALARADQVDRGEITGRLAGIPFAVKDNYLVAETVTTAASNMLKDFKAPITASVVKKLEDEGAICIGKTNLDAFAHGSSTENSAFGVTKNAIDQSKVAGGSSGGSAVAVALGIVPFALGSDTGGSIRQPASFNGVVGVKPTYGMTSRYGVVAMASSTDVMGCFTNSAEDAELILSIMAGRDDNDMTTLPDYFSPAAKATSLKIGVIEEFMGEGTDPDVKDRVDNYIEHLRSFGHTVENVSLSMARYSLAIYYIIVPAEVSSNLARYDGVRYGTRGSNASLNELYGLSRDQGFTAENKRRIIIGSFVLSSGYFDAYYQKAQRARTKLISEFNDLFSRFDILLSPTVPTTAFGIGENTDDPIKMYLSDAMTVSASLAGLPAISVPAGVDENNMPVGVQLIGPMKSDGKLLALAKSMETRK